MSDDFDFEEDDWVLVKYREPDGMRVKFVAQCTGIESRGGLTSPNARFELPFGTMNSVTIRPYEGEFTVVDGPEEVNF